MRDQYYTYHGSVVGIVFDTKKRTPFTHARTHTHARAHTHTPHTSFVTISIKDMNSLTYS